MPQTLFSSRPKQPTLLREWNGVLTEDLVQQPGEHGLGKLPKRLTPDATTTSICGYCGTGCQLKIHLKNNEAVNLSAETNYPVNLGMACPKGWEALTPLEAHDRATTPLIRNAEGKLVSTDWHTALLEFVTRTKKIQQRYGPHSVAWLGTGQMTVEDFAMLGSLAKFGMGLRHGDGNTRQCMATAVAAYKESLGFDAPPFTYEDFEESDCLVFVGSNACIAHPIMWQRVMRNKRNPEIVVIDPRKTETAMAATLHYPIQPKSDLVLLYAIAREIIHNGWIKQDYIDRHTKGFGAFASFVEPFTLEVASEKTAIGVEQLRVLAELIGTRDRVSFWWTMGVNQSYEGTRVAQAIINLCLMTGNIGRAGTGPNSITGQCNAMGSRLFSNTTSLLGGHSFTNAEHRKKVADIMGIPVDRIPDQNSYAYDQILEAIHSGEIRALWFVATNPAHSWIQVSELRERFKKLELLIVQDMYLNTATAELADIVLPAAGWGEKDGTLINSERRIGRIRKVRRAPGQALDDFSIFKAISHCWGCGEMFSRWETPEAVFQTLKEITREQPCDITGVEDYDHLDRMGGIQWPFPESMAANASSPDVTQRRLFEDAQFYTRDRRAMFCFSEPQQPPESPSAAFPFILLTGRGSSSQWHTGTRTDKSDVLRKLYPRNVYFEINPEDAAKLHIRHGEVARLTSPRGSVVAKANVTPVVKPGQLFVPMHYKEVNELTRADFDPHSREPNFKYCSVKVSKY